MAYIGKTPITGNFVKLDAISVVNGQAAYTMNNGGSAFTNYNNVNQFLVSLNGILQSPTTSFSVASSTITFASNLSTGDVIDFIIVLGNTLDVGVPSDNTVTNAKTNFVSTSSAAGLQIKGDGTTDGTLQLNCSQNSHGVKIASPAHSAGQSYTLTLPTGNVTADKFLKVASVSGSGATGVGQLSFADAGGNSPSFRAKRNADQSISSSSWVKIQFDTELFDTDNNYDNSTNHRFTPTTAGKYYVFGQVRHDWTGSWGHQNHIAIYRNGSQYVKNEFYGNGSGVQHYKASFVADIIDFNGSSDYVEIYAYANSSGAVVGGTHSFFGAFKLGGV